MIGHDPQSGATGYSVKTEVDVQYSDTRALECTSIWGYMPIDGAGANWRQIGAKLSQRGHRSTPNGIDRTFN
jgi:hypothetical protein